MGKLVVNLSVTLDGVMQAPGRPDEDTREGFQYGGWALPYFDPVMIPAMGEGMGATLLFGRRTWPVSRRNPTGTSASSEAARSSAL